MRWGKRRNGYVALADSAGQFARQEVRNPKYPPDRELGGQPGAAEMGLKTR